MTTDKFRIVPEEPTEEMMNRFWRQTGESEQMRSRVYDRFRRYWKEALAAAPPAPVQTNAHTAWEIVGYGCISPDGTRAVSLMHRDGLFPLTFAPAIHALKAQFAEAGDAQERGRNDC